jgi:aldose 1-epimerase
MVSLALGKARVELAPEVGGAIAEFTFAGVDVLRRTPPAARTAGDVRRHVLSARPYSNRIANAPRGRGRRRGTRAELGDHPNSIRLWVGSVTAWSATTRTSALLALEHLRMACQYRAAMALPRDAVVQACGARGGSTLTVKLAIVNTGDAAFPFGLGLHPFFPRTAKTSLDFDVDGVWENDAMLLPIRRVAIPPGWRHGLIAARREETLDNVFTQWKGLAMLTDPARPFDTGIAADRAAGFVVVYAPVARNFLAVEPVTHMTDAFNRAARGETGTGTRILAAGMGFSCTIRIFVRVRP